MMMETSSTRLTLSPLARTDTITLLPRSFIGLYEKMEILAALPVTVIARRDLFGLIWRGDSVITSAVKAVFQSLRTMLSKSQSTTSPQPLACGDLTLEHYYCISPRETISPGHLLLKGSEPVTRILIRGRWRGNSFTSLVTRS
jgi:hypothetical protein